jgi:hypothetical protein
MKILLGFKNLVFSTLFLAAVTSVVAVLIHLKGAPYPVPFPSVNIQSMLNVLGGLFVVALMVERAVEVIISVLRDADAQIFLNDIATIQAKLTAAKAVTPLPQDTIQELSAELDEIQRGLARYRSDTKETTYCISFTLGVALALVGVRALHGLLTTAPTSGWFSLVDIIVTGAVIAGGSDGVHQMVTSAVDFFNMLSATSAKKAAA